MAQKKLNAGSQAPDFTLPDASGNMVSLKNFRGSWLVLYFYPRDNTSGCTLEAVDFTGRAKDFKKLKASIVGISPDTVDSHRKFIEKQELGITLLSDSGRTVLIIEPDTPKVAFRPGVTCSRFVPNCVNCSST